MSDDQELIREFLVESYENLDQLDRELVVLEQQPGDRALLASIFRTVHTIKGSSGFFNLKKLQALTHAGEHLLGLLRDGKLAFHQAIGTAMLEMGDAVRAMLAHVEADATDGDESYAGLIARLEALRTAKPPSAPTPAIPRPSEATAAMATPPVVFLPSTAEPPANAPDVAGFSIEVEEYPVVAGASISGDTHSSLSDQNIRVDVGLLDKLMNLVGELVLARNQILQSTTLLKDPGFLNTTQRLNLITTELQEGVMKTRMQQIGTIWNRFPRLVRDLALACDKQVRLEMEGADTELDRTLIEAIRDPLTHILRNSVDHGIEMADRRVARGKPAEGFVKLRAFHEGGQVNIEITDDGAGIDPQRVLTKAVERGIVTREQAARMSDRELTQLIFLPGFSTADRITNVSGRGVGMDVVKTNIEKIGGTVDLQSQPGTGTTLRIKIPLTLAIIPALVVVTAGDRYAIPQVSLLELVRLEGEQAKKGIETVHNAPVYRLRGNLLPLVYLDRELWSDEGEASRQADEAVNIVVLQADDRQFGLVVDGINDTEEIVVKPLGKQLKGISLFAGATIMGDGRVALILDVLGLAQRAAVVSAGRDRKLAEQAARPAEGRQALRHLLLLGLGQRRLAMPLELVARLEEIAAGTLETAVGEEVVQYRGDILPLVRLADVLGEPSARGRGEGESLQVVVYAERGRSVGLVVDKILDVVEAAVELRPTNRRAGIAGSTVIQQRVTDLLDVRGLLQAAGHDIEAELLPV